MDAREISVEALLAQLGWLRRLALSLASDEAEADDLVQDVWQTASAQRTAPSHLRAWLRTVLVNRWRMSRRGAARRVFYERVKEPATETAGPEDALARAQLQQRLAELVLALDEPARGIVLLRYYEARSSSEIARQLGMPAATVRWHLARALDRLRHDLDAKEGGRARWVWLLAPRPERGRQVTPAAPIAAAAVLLALGAGMYGMVQMTRRAEVQSRSVSPTPRIETDAKLATTASKDPPRLIAPRGGPVADGGMAASGQGACETAQARVLGLVRDIGGPIPRARICKVRYPAVVECQSADDAGRFVRCVEQGVEMLQVDAEGYASRIEQVIAQSDHIKHEFVLAPEARLSGRVLDKRDSRPLPGAIVVLHPVGIFRENELPARSAVANDAGYFTIPGLAGCRYTVFARSGTERLEDKVEIEAIPGATRGNVELRLVPGVTVRGVVRGPRGPVAGIWVKVEMGWPFDETPHDETNAEGRFELVAIPRRQVHLSVQDHDITAGGEVDATRAVDGWVVEVRERPALRGRVVHHGVPVSQVMVEAGTHASDTDQEGHFAMTGVPYGPVELSVRAAHMSGSLSVDYKPEMEPVTLDLHDNATVSGTLLDADGVPMWGAIVAFWALDRKTSFGAAAGWGQSSQDGRYTVELTGRPEGRYRITVSTSLNSPVKLRPVNTFPIVEMAAGEQRREGILLKVERPNAVLTGRVIDSTGAPLADAELQIVPAKLKFLPFDTPRVLSRPDGTFVIGGLPPGDYAIRARSGGAETLVEASTGRDVIISLPQSH